MLRWTACVQYLTLLGVYAVAGPAVTCMEKYATMPASTHSGPMKLMSLEEAQARSLSPNHPARKERQRENSLPDTSTAAMYHTVIDLAENKYAAHTHTL